MKPEDYSPQGGVIYYLRFNSSNHISRKEKFEHFLVLAWNNKILATQSCDEQSTRDQTTKILLVWLPSFKLENIYDPRGPDTAEIQEERQPHSAWTSLGKFSRKDNLRLWRLNGTWTVRRKTQVNNLRCQIGSALTALWEIIFRCL